jgi:hypothetical protein
MMVLIFNFNSFAAFSTADGYTSTELFSTEGTYTTCGGLDIDGGSVYFGNFDKVKSLDLNSGNISTVGNIGSNYENVLVTRHSGLTYTAFGVEGINYPYKMGYIDGSGNYVNQLDEDGIYDAAVNSQGDCYIVANPDAIGSQIFKYDWDDGETTLIADVGGYSGGLAFDGTGNLYYADQGSESREASILMFTNEQIAGGGLYANDAESVLDIAGRYLTFDDDGYLYASTGYGATLAKYDLSTNSILEEIAYGSIGKFTIYDDSIYAIDTDWRSYYSTIQQITQIPEPATIFLLGFAGLWLRRRSR